MSRTSNDRAARDAAFLLMAACVDRDERAVQGLLDELDDLEQLHYVLRAVLAIIDDVLASDIKSRERALRQRLERFMPTDPSDAA